MTLANAIQVTFNGLAIGLLYALILLGILLIFRVSRVVNFGHGQFAMLGGLGSLYLSLAFGISLWLAVPVAIVTTGILAFAVQRVLVERLPEGVEGNDMALTLGIFLALTAVAENILQQGPPLRYPRLTDRAFNVAGAFIDGNVLVGLIVGMVLFGGSFLMLKRSRVGQVLRAAAEDPQIAESLGWNVQLIRAITWMIAGGIAAIAGILIAFRIPVHSQYVTTTLIKAFVAGIVGGLHRFVAPLFAAIGLGLFENWLGFFFGAQIRVPGVFGLVILVMAFAPRRLLAGREEARA